MVDVVCRGSVVLLAGWTAVGMAVGTVDRNASVGLAAGVSVEAPCDTGLDVGDKLLGAVVGP